MWRDVAVEDARAGGMLKEGETLRAARGAGKTEDRGAPQGMGDVTREWGGVGLFARCSASGVYGGGMGVG